jgi:hypothetical protein
MDHRPILVVVLVFIAVFAVLTIATVVKSGPDILTVFSLLVLGLFGFGILGALREPPQE